MEKVNIVKIGGNILDHAPSLSGFLKQFTQLEGPKVLVHGGGKAATQQAEKLGIPVKMVEGRRITDKHTLEIVVQVYAGALNKGLVARLQSMGCNALGLTGADLNVIPAKKREHPTIDFGFVGDFETDTINAAVLSTLLDAGVCPVFCALTHDGKGHLLNTNADTIASGLAIALSIHYESHLYYCFEKNGVLSDPANEESVIEKLDYDLYRNLKQNQVIRDGMIPKLDNAFSALESGVSEIHIIHARNLLKSYGTQLYL